MGALCTTWAVMDFHVHGRAAYNRSLKGLLQYVVDFHSIAMGVDGTDCYVVQTTFG